MKNLTLIIKRYVLIEELTYILPLLIFFSCAQQSTEQNTSTIESIENNDLKKSRLFGDIKSIKSEQFQITENFDGYKEKERKKNWGEYRSQSKNQYYTYNIYGLKRFNNYFLQNSYILFNEDGNIKCIEGFHDKNLISKTIYEYDSSNVLVSEKWYEKEDLLKYETTFTYNDKEDLESRTFEYPNKKLEAKLIHRFDTNNNVSALMVYKTGKVEEYHSYKYDSLNNLIESSQFSSNGDLLIKSIFQYNTHNDITERKIFEAKNAVLRSHTTYKYKYDNSNNWIEQVYYKNGGIPYLLVKRKIEYY